MKKGISLYDTLVFDCDGVILNSNSVKTSAFYKAALPYGEQQASALVKHHIMHGGVSRYEKFSFFFREILNVQPETGEMERLLENYGALSREGLMSCKVSSCLDELRANTSESKWIVASGSDQKELRQVMEKRNIAHLFDGGIFGSPDSKVRILERELSSKQQTKDTLFIGDSAHDYAAATAMGLDFVFLDKWTESMDFRDQCFREGITVKPDLQSLI